MKDKTALLKIRFVLLMALFGLLGPLVRAIGLPSPVTACLRAWVSAAALIAFCLVSRRPIDREELKRTLLPMAVCGALIALDWIGLFAAYHYTTVATATVCYYVEPILILLASPLLLGERFTARHLICALTAFVGMVFVSGVAENGFAAADIRGPLFALLGATGYACVVLINKRIPSGDSILRTTVQLSVAALVTSGAALLLLLGVGLTAIPYIIYFSLIVRIPARSVAIFSYADPVMAVLLSMFLLGEKMTLFGLVGTVLIIGAAMISELGGNKNAPEASEDERRKTEGE